MNNKPIFTIRLGIYRIEFYKQLEFVTRVKKMIDKIKHDEWLEKYRIF